MFRNKEIRHIRPSYELLKEKFSTISFAKIENKLHELEEQSVELTKRFMELSDTKMKLGNGNQILKEHLIEQDKK